MLANSAFSSVTLTGRDNPIYIGHTVLKRARNDSAGQRIRAWCADAVATRRFSFGRRLPLKSGGRVTCTAPNSQ
jgi:hypothetical protein